MGVAADELADLIDQEDDPVVLALLIEVLLDPFAEVLDGEREVLFGLVDPLFSGLLALAGSGGPGLDDLIVVES